ncbi:hypothetical protein N431DRAFT_501443 [Stipitochalara longipes BDJ]|nr:hypothetical protein N431DRAFT_501443 [Stipitochalara longipes BDJ]
MVQHESSTAVGKSQNSNRSHALQKFKLFPKLPPELRDKVWKFAAPGPQIVSVYAGMSFTRIENSEKTNGSDTITKISKNRFKLGFHFKDQQHGMLRACRESHCRKELRLGAHDALWIDDLDQVLQDLEKAHRYGLKVPLTISQISILIISASFGEGTNQREFLDSMESDKTFQRCLPIFENLHTLVFACSRLPLFVRAEDFCFSEYSTSFHFNNLSFNRREILSEAQNCERRYNHQVEKWQRKHKLNQLEFPEIKIMAKGWPVE